MAEQQAAPEKVKLTVSGVLADLSNGLDRVAIRQKYSLSATDVKRLFEHEKLKGARVKKAPAFELEDDTTDAAPKAEKPVAKAPAPAPVTASTAAVNEALAEEEETAEETPAAEVVASEPKEVSSPDDDVEVADKGAEVKQGLW